MGIKFSYFAEKCLMPSVGIIGESIVTESIVGSKFTGRVVAETTFGAHNAVIPEVDGTAFITGRHEFLIDPQDEFPEGFILR